MRFISLLNVVASASVLGRLRSLLFPRPQTDVPIPIHEKQDDNWITLLSPLDLPERFTPLSLTEIASFIDAMDRSQFDMINEYQHSMELLAETCFSKIFVVDRSQVIKYQVHAPVLTNHLEETLHPLAREYWFLKELDGLGISPSVSFLSLPEPLPLIESFASPIHQFRMSQSDWQECVWRSCAVRSLLMERVGKSLGEYVTRGSTQRIGLEEMASIGTQLFGVLRVLHSKGIVHGDIHPGNICRKGGKRFVLIDFGLASYVEKHGYPMGNKLPNHGEYNHPYLSPWEMQGFRSSYRDDAYRMLLTLSFLLNGRCLYDRLDSLNSKIRDALLMKRTVNVFLVLNDDLVEIESGRVNANPKIISSLLGTIWRTIMDAGDRNIDEIPDYDRIIGTFEELVASLKER
jgi:hypothetical protein